MPQVAPTNRIRVENSNTFFHQCDDFSRPFVAEQYMSSSISMQQLTVPGPCLALAQATIAMFYSTTKERQHKAIPALMQAVQNVKGKVDFLILVVILSIQSHLFTQKF